MLILSSSSSSSSSSMKIINHHLIKINILPANIPPLCCGTAGAGAE